MDISGLRARQLRRADFQRFDWLLCADAQNLRDVRAQAPAQHADKVALLLEWAGIEPGGSIPDPYTGGSKDFEHAWRLVDSAAQAVVARLSVR